MDLQFGHYRLKRRERQVLGPQGPVELSARSFEILALLLARPDEVIGKTEIFEIVWPGLVVEENTLQVHISALRKALDTGMIMTVHGRGYKYAGLKPVAVPTGAIPSDAAREVASQMPLASLPSTAVLPQADGLAPAIVQADNRLGLSQSHGISIVVLPFVNMSSDQEQGFLADGLTEDLTTELSRLKDLLVIASNTAFTYKGRAVDMAQVGRELGVRYVLEGSMRYLGPRVRISAQLIDVNSGNQLWAEKFDRERAELFDIQDEVVRAVVASTQIQLMIREGENRVREANEDCWALTMQASAQSYKMTDESLARSEQIARRLTREYPQWARGYSLLASAIYHQIIMGFQPANTERKDETLRVARQSVLLDPKDEFNLLHLAMPLLDFEGDTGEAIVLLRRALDINPSFSVGYGLMGDTHLALGQPDEAMRNAEFAIRLNPRDPSNFYRYETLAMASLQKGDDNKAMHWASQIIALKPDYWSGYTIAVAVLAGRGELDQARRSADALKKCWPGVSISAIKAALTRNDAPWRQRYFENLLAAGIPE